VEEAKGEGGSLGLFIGRPWQYQRRDILSPTWWFHSARYPSQLRWFVTVRAYPRACPGARSLAMAVDRAVGVAPRGHDCREIKGSRGERKRVGSRGFQQHPHPYPHVPSRGGGAAMAVWPRRVWRHSIHVTAGGRRWR
jgi:hypothetical protein